MGIAAQIQYVYQASRKLSSRRHTLSLKLDAHLFSFTSCLRSSTLQSHSEFGGSILVCLTFCAEVWCGASLVSCVHVSVGVFLCLLCEIRLLILFSNYSFAAFCFQSGFDRNCMKRTTEQINSILSQSFKQKHFHSHNE